VGTVRAHLVTLTRIAEGRKGSQDLFMRDYVGEHGAASWRLKKYALANMEPITGRGSGVSREQKKKEIDVDDASMKGVTSQRR